MLVLKSLRGGLLTIILSVLLCAVAMSSLTAASQVKSLTQYGITWTFDKEYPCGQYVTGDYWVLGPVNIIGIENNWHTHGFKPELGLDGSMVNPGTGTKQGYDKRLNSYDASLNVAIHNGASISADNPLQLAVHSSLISTVSWLAKSDKDKEPGCPGYNMGTKAPRPVLRDAAILTVIDVAPAQDAFRPAYCAPEKTASFTKTQLKLKLLPKLNPVASLPNISKLELSVQRPWIEHGHQYLGAMIHPTENMPEYGRDLSIMIGNIGLALLLDFNKIESKPSQDKLLIGFIQLGIDLTGIADNGGSWPSNGGHLMGRKWPILFAGLLLDNEHMKNVGQWETDFQEDLDTFYVSQAEIDMSHSEKWKPDKRAPAKTYETEHLSMPEWGIRHRADPEADNADWGATYRVINNQSYAGFVLAAHIMGQKKAWNHDALFDYIDRSTHFGSQGSRPGTANYAIYAFGNGFIHDMWQAYRSSYGCQWKSSSEDVYSTGALNCDACKFNCEKQEQK